MSLRDVRPSAGGLPAGFLLRLIDGDTGFVQRAPRGLIRGAILSTRCLALPDSGRLIHAVRTMGIPFIMDPDTAVLVDVDADHDRAAWLRAMPAAATLTSLPIYPEHLAGEDAVEVFTRAVASSHRGARALSAGYFRIATPDDPWRAVNRRLVAETIKLAAGRHVCAWLELTLKSLLDHDLVRVVAPDLEAVRIIVLRVAGLRPATVTEDEAFAVLDAVAALHARGPQVVLDCVGTLGAAALPVGAHAFSGGATHHRSVPVTLVHRRSPSSRALGYEVPLQFREIPRDAAVKAAGEGDLEVCGDDSCRALDPMVAKGRRPGLLRKHFIHTADVDGQFAGYVNAATLASEMLASPDLGAQAWGRALARFAAAAAASTHSPR